MIFNIAVCDDEQVTGRQIRDILMAVRDIPVHVDIYDNGKQLAASGQVYQLIFLDIGMKSLNGIETARLIRQHDKKTRIVFVTAFKEYAAAAFDVHAFGYILKPVSSDRILAVCREAYQWFLEDENCIKLNFETTEGLVILESRQIYYFEYENRKTKMVTARGNYYLNMKITDVYHRMRDQGFEMPHKSYVVNMLHIRTIVGFNITMTNGDMVFLSQKKASAFRKMLCSFIGKQR